MDDFEVKEVMMNITDIEVVSDGKTQVIYINHEQDHGAPATLLFQTTDMFKRFAAQVAEVDKRLV